MSTTLIRGKYLHVEGSERKYLRNFSGPVHIPKPEGIKRWIELFVYPIYNPELAIDIVPLCQKGEDLDD